MTDEQLTPTTALSILAEEAGDCPCVRCQAIRMAAEALSARQQAVLTKNSLLEPMPPNTSGATQAIVKWQIELPSGKWLGAWDKEAFDEYSSIICNTAP